MLTYKIRFLLAHLFVESLKDKVSVKLIRKTLNELQNDSKEKEPRLTLLRRAYDNVMKRIDGQPVGYKELAKHVLSWIVCAKRPLKTTDVQYAWAVKDSEDELDETAIPDAEDMLSACCGLVVIDKDSEIIRLAHHTAQEYFQDTWSQWFPTAHLDIAKTCVSFLSFKDFSGGPVRTYEEACKRLEIPLFTYAVDCWGHHASACCFCTPQLIELLTKSEWVSMVAQLCDLFSEIRKNPGQLSEALQPSQNAFHIVGAYGLNDLVKALLVHAPDIDPDRQDNYGKTPLSWAAGMGCPEVVKTLLTDDRVDPDRPSNGDLTPLGFAALNGRLEVVKTLLSDSRVDPDRQDDSGRTPLAWAAMKGHTEIVKTLLSDGRVDPDRQNSGGGTPLNGAAWNGHAEVVKTLLCDGRVNPNQHDKQDQTPLGLAAWYGHTEVIKALLSDGRIDPNRQDTNGQTPICLAAYNGRTEVVVTLLSDGRVDPNKQDNSGRTPLSYAAMDGHLEVVKTLLSDSRVDPDRPDDYGRTPLGWAALQGRTEIVKTLLSDDRVDPNRQDNNGATPQRYATSTGHVEIFKILFHHGRVDRE